MRKRLLRGLTTPLTEPHVGKAWEDFDDGLAEDKGQRLYSAAREFMRGCQRTKDDWRHPHKCPSCTLAFARAVERIMRSVSGG